MPLRPNPERTGQHRLWLMIILAPAALLVFGVVIAFVWSWFRPLSLAWDEHQVTFGYGCWLFNRQTPGHYALDLPAPLGGGTYLVTWR